ncbi:MAG: GDSL-type esterase/lipase family protein [Chloroflexota bacterium]|nr:GDSL-type esterase/lipase family protein [Chloroflexota bacterium]
MRTTTYVALGDSLAAGVGATDPGRTGYVPLVHQRLRDAGRGHDRLVNLAVSGETSASFVAYGQMEAARRVIEDPTADVRLVTLDIGANDLLRLAPLEPCASAPQGDACRATIRQAVAAFEAAYRSILESLLHALERSAPDARLVVLTYYNPLSGTADEVEPVAELALLGDDGTLDCDAAQRSTANRGLNDVIACLARDRGLTVADVHPRFAGRGAGLTLIERDDVHPNDAGHAVMADAVVDAVLQSAAADR